MRILCVKQILRVLFVSLTAVVCIVADATSVSAQEHLVHQHMAIPEMDENGRRLDPNAQQHNMNDAQLAALRKKIALYRALTDNEARMNMALMGPNYEWYVSDTSKRADIGVLILSHGVGKNSDKLVVDKLKPMSKRWPTAVSFGMAMMMSSFIQSAVDDLTERGVSTIVLVPTAVTQHNSLTRQWKYIFGMHDESSYLDVPRVKTDANVVMSAHFEDHPLISEALLEHTMEQSEDPPNEVVILVGHGPEDIEDNILDLEILQAHVDHIATAASFSDVKVINLQDDAYPPIRKSNVKKLRRWITSAQRQGKKVIVTVVTSASYGVQAHIQEDLRGLNYRFAKKGLLEHPNYLQWLEKAVEERLAAE